MSEPEAISEDYDLRVAELRKKIGSQALEKLADQLATEKAERARRNALSLYKPYPRQSEFHAAGAWASERLLRAGNQQGKCVSFQTLIDHPDGTKSRAGDLFNAGKPFPVLSWNGSEAVPAIAVRAIVKSPEPMVRVNLSSGEWFECALNHRVLTGGGYAFVGQLLASVPCLPYCGSVFDPLIRGAGDRHWSGRPPSFPVRCWSGLRLCGARLLAALTVAPIVLPLPGDAPGHSRYSAHLGGPGPKQASTRSYLGRGRPSTWGDQARALARSAWFLTSAENMTAPRKRAIPRLVRLLATAVASHARSFASAILGQGGSVPLVSPIAGNKIVSYQPIAAQCVYDFTVPGYHNYLCAGVVHHNTMAGGMETAYHLTGRYPDWWEGRRFEHPIECWAACDTGEATRDNPQRVLIGPVGAHGSGAIPADTIIEKWSGRGVANLLDTVLIRHVTGGVSRLGFKRYDQGRESWQGTAKNVIWCDEEPPLDVYSEALARLIATRGIIYTTFTPLRGMSAVVTRLLTKAGQEDEARREWRESGEEGKKEPSRTTADINMTIDDAQHIPIEERERIIAAFPLHEREARARGVPMLGSGRVFPVAEEVFVCQAFDIPNHWAQLGAMDFGYDHPFAAVKLAWDRDADCVYVTQTYRVREQTPTIHGLSLKAWGNWLPWVWPHDGMTHDRASGETLAAQYRKAGLRMSDRHATFPDGSIGFEAGIMEMLDRLQTGRLKVFNHLTEWLEEFRLYHRKDGIVVKLRDDLMSATRVGIMAKRFARPHIGLVGGGRPALARGLA